MTNKHPSYYSVKIQEVDLEKLEKKEYFCIDGEGEGYYCFQTLFSYHGIVEILLSYSEYKAMFPEAEKTVDYLHVEGTEILPCTITTTCGDLPSPLPEKTAESILEKHQLKASGYLSFSQEKWVIEAIKEALSV